MLCPESAPADAGKHLSRMASSQATAPTDGGSDREFSCSASSMDAPRPQRLAAPTGRRARGGLRKFIEKLDRHDQLDEHDRRAEHRRSRPCCDRACERELAPEPG